MKKVYSFIVLLLLSLVLNAKGNLTALFSYCTFNIPDGTPYVETYLQVVSNSVKFITADNKTLQGQLEVQWLVKGGDTITHLDKYILNSPAVGINDSIKPDFLDQRRIQLKPGKYKLELTIKDRNSETNPVTLNQEINVGFPSDSVSISDIEFIDSYTKTEKAGRYTKSGYDIVPALKSFYPKENTDLKFYAEIYRTDKVINDEYLLRYFIAKYDGNTVVPNYSFNVRQKAASTNVILTEIPIQDLASGNYNLNVEVRNKKNELIASKQSMFQRSNPKTKSQVTNDFSKLDVTNTFTFGISRKDSLIELIDCLHPIASNVEIDISDQLMIDADIEMMQRFLYYFWQKRNPLDPELEWRAYMKEVEKTNQMFTSVGVKGYATDRGRVYLQYGPPNAISKETQDPSAYPYEIWQYYKLKTQSNRKFVFYSKELSANDYKLLHSDAIGELSQPQWEAMLHERQNGPIGIDQKDTYDIYGSRAKENFNNPH